MSLMARVAARLQRPDLVQATALLLAALVVALVVNWPDAGARVNDSWSVVAPLRNAALALLAMVLGSGLGARPEGAGTVSPTESPAEAPQPRATYLALLAVLVLTLPFELAAQSASYPATQFWWPTVAALLTVTGYFGLGLLLGRLVRGPYSGALLLAVVPISLAALVWLDLATGVMAFNPWAAPLVVAPSYLAAMLALSLPALLVLRGARA